MCFRLSTECHVAAANNKISKYSALCRYLSFDIIEDEKVKVEKRTDLLSSISLVRQTTWLANARLSANYVFFFFFVFDSNVYRNASLVNHSTHRSHVCFLRVNCVSMCVCIWWWRSYCAVVVVYFVLLCRCYYCQCSVVRVSKISTTHVFGYMRYIVAVILFHIRIQSVYQGFSKHTQTHEHTHEHKHKCICVLRTRLQRPFYI